MVNASDILQLITLGVTSWVLIEVINHGKTIAAIKQRLKDLPCPVCNPPKTKTERNYED